MRDHYQMELEAEEERQKVAHRVRARIDGLRSFSEVKSFIGKMNEAVVSVKMRKRITKWLRERVEILKGN